MKISIVVPAHNEERNLTPLHREIKTLFEEGGVLSQYEYEVIIVDDGSTDTTAAIAAALAEENVRVCCLELSRNFGKEIALTAGLHVASGDAAVLMDADLQHPPAVIPELVAPWEKGAEVVIGVRKKSVQEGFARSFFSKAFSFFLMKTGDIPTVKGATDFRLLDRVVIDAFRAFTERGRLTRGLIDWLGFQRAYVSFVAQARNAGDAQYGYRKLFGLAFTAFVSHSLLPLRIAGYLGLPITIFAGGLGMFILIEQVIFDDPWMLKIPGTAMLAVMILFLNGILLMVLGLISLYIEHIRSEALNRPLYVIRKRYGSQQ